ncbi:Thiosulfate sulfurtransferase 18 [Linum perenne]
MGSLEESSGAEVVTVDVHKTKFLIQSGHVYLDVRTEEEFRAAHPDAETIRRLRGQPEKEADDAKSAPKKNIYNIPYMFNTSHGRMKNHEFVEKVKEMLKEDDHLIVGCQSGVRSLSATADLLSASMSFIIFNWDKLLNFLMASLSQAKMLLFLSGAEEVSAIDVHKAKSLIESGHVYLMSGWRRISGQHMPVQI